MKIFTTTASVIALTALTAPAAMAASILIDDFSTAQRVVDDPDGVSPNTSTEAIGILGADRTLTAETDPASVAGTILESMGAPVNTLNFTNTATADGQFGMATVKYDFAALVDLTDGGTNNKFFFEVLFADLEDTVLTTTVESTSGSDSFEEVLGAIFNPFTDFAEFTGVDFTEVSSLTFEFDATDVRAFDGVVGSISVVPLPASALLLLGGLGGFAGLSAANPRRRRKEV